MKLISLVVILICQYAHADGQSFISNLFHRRKVIFSDATFSDTEKKTPYIDGSICHVKVKKSPAFANQPTSYLSTSTTNPEKDNTDANCTTQKIKVTAQSVTFMNAAVESQSQHLFPGAIYEFDSFWDGSFNEQANYRKPIRISTENKNMTVPTFEDVLTPSMSTIRNSIASLASRFNNKIVGTQCLRYQTYDYQDRSELSIKLSAGISFPMTTIQTDFKSSTNKFHHYITVDAIKTLYTINALKNSDGYFNTNQSSLKNPIIISSVTYGIRILANLDIKTETDTQFIDFKARYSGLVTSGNVDFSYLKKANLNEQTINCFVVGGPGESTVSFTQDELEKGIEKLLANVTYATAQPITYTISDLQGNVIGTESATDDITVKNCQPSMPVRKLQSAIVTWKTGGDNKNNETNYTLALYQNNINDPAPSGVAVSVNDKSKFSNPNDLVAWHNDRSNQEYPDGENGPPISLNINKDEKYNDFTQGGVLQLHMESPNDTWRIDNLVLTLTYDDKTSQKMTWSNLYVSTKHMEQYLFFDNKFNIVN